MELKELQERFRKGSKKLYICRCVEIGKRGRLKICCQQWLVRKSPDKEQGQLSLPSFDPTG